MQFLTIQLAAVDTKVYDIAGNYFEIIDSSGPINVAFYDRNGTKSKDLDLGSALSGAFVGGVYSRIEITNGYGIAQSVTLMYGSGTGGTRRQPGNVRIIDNSRDLTASGNQFFGSYARTSGAAAFAIVGFRAVAKTVFLRRLMVGSSMSGLVTVFTCTGDPTTTPTVQSGIGRNLIAGVGATSSCKGVTGESAAASPTVGELPGATSFATLLVTANQFLDISFSSPIQLNPGMGIVIVPNIATVTAFLCGAFEEL